jgi:LDH2 family malate/lactate/ureidoglycolate dehydrogenase
VKDAPRYRLDDLRRFATALAAGVGVPPARAAVLAAQVLWYDVAGAPDHGIQSLANWLEHIAAQRLDPAAEGRVGAERNGTAVLDGQKGLPPLILARAAELAVEKARDAGVGLVRVVHLGAMGSAAAVAAEVAVGPMGAAALGPRSAWTLALPTIGGLPVVFDSALGAEPAWPGAHAGLRDVLAPWAAALAPEGSWLLAAFAVAALEPLATFQERVSAAFEATERPESCCLVPARWEPLRRDARERGVPLRAATWNPLKHWAERLGVPPPEPIHR